MLPPSLWCWLDGWAGQHGVPQCRSNAMPFSQLIHPQEIEIIKSSRSVTLVHSSTALRGMVESLAASGYQTGCTASSAPVTMTKNWISRFQSFHPSENYQRYHWILWGCDYSSSCMCVSDDLLFTDHSKKRKFKTRQGNDFPISVFSRDKRNQLW